MNATMTKIKALTKIHNHGEAYRVAALMLGLNELAGKFDSINRQQAAAGCLPEALYHQRFAAYQELMAAAKATMLAPKYTRFYNLF